MVDISIVNGIINQLITWGHHLVEIVDLPIKMGSFMGFTGKWPSRNS